MPGCGGFGAANTGEAIIVRAAAKELAIVAAEMTFFDFIRAILSGNRNYELIAKSSKPDLRRAGESGNARDS